MKEKLKLTFLFQLFFLLLSTIHKKKGIYDNLYKVFVY